jgi:anti-sigma regulatory factor (Ser/Thr protein kinase)
MVEVHSRIEIPADLAELAAVREAVRDVARHCEAPATCMDDLVQAVDEAVRT